LLKELITPQSAANSANVFVGKLGDILIRAIGEPLGYALNWSRLWSLWPVHIETACCSLEFGAASGPRWDVERFGIIEAFGSLRQCDLVVVQGTITRKMAPRLRMVYDQMPDPKYVIAMGACAITGGLYFDSYNVLPGIDGIIPGGISIKDFSVVTRTDEETARSMLDSFLQNGIGTYEDHQVFFDENDRLKTCLLAIRMGAPIDEVSRSLDWKDFESLAAEILEASEFETTRNLILTKPRMQIDVVGVKSDVAILIDCKHWKRASHSSLEKAVKKQIERTKRFLKTENVKIAIPAIVTLYQEKLMFIHNVPVIPIFQLRSFCEEFYGNLDDLNTLEHS